MSKQEKMCVYFFVVYPFPFYLLASDLSDLVRYQH